MPRISPCTVLHSAVAASCIGERLPVEAEEIAAEPEDTGNLVLEDTGREHGSFYFLSAS